MLFFIIPAYNEERNIPLLLETTSRKMKEMGLPYRLIVINDGSTDGTRPLLESYQKEYPIVLLNHDTNKNVGQVFRTGFKYTLRQIEPGDIVVTKEADNTGDIHILDEMLQKIDIGYDLVLASCYAPGGKVLGTTLDRIILSFGANFLLKCLFPIKGVYTYSSFYRAYRAEMLRKAFLAYENQLIEEEGFACMVEMLIKLSRLPIRIAEVPMILRCNFRQGVSKMNKRKTIAAYFRLIKKELGTNNNDIQKVIMRYRNQ